MSNDGCVQHLKWEIPRTAACLGLHGILHALRGQAAKSRKLSAQSSCSTLLCTCCTLCDFHPIMMHQGHLTLCGFFKDEGAPHSRR